MKRQGIILGEEHMSVIQEVIDSTYCLDFPSQQNSELERAVIL